MNKTKNTKQSKQESSQLRDETKTLNWRRAKLRLCATNHHTHAVKRLVGRHGILGLVDIIGVVGCSSIVVVVVVFSAAAAASATSSSITVQNL